METRLTAFPRFLLSTSKHVAVAAFQALRHKVTERRRESNRCREQQQRLRAMTDHELLRSYLLWGSDIAHYEIRRRGLPIPGPKGR